jgi:hypothetical protein
MRILPNLPGAVRLAAIAALLSSSSAFAHEFKAVENTFTGCIGPHGAVLNLKRGDEPGRECTGRSKEVRLSGAPAGLSVISWDVVLEIGEDFSPAPGIEISCSGDPDFSTELTITIDGESMGEMSTMDIGHEYEFVFTGSNSTDSGPPFIVRAAGLAFTGQPDIAGPCGSAGYAEMFEWPPLGAGGAGLAMSED